MTVASSPSPSLSPAQLPLYGRKYQIQILLPQADGSQKVLTVADSSFEPEALRVTFDVGTYWFRWIWYADLSIYNLDQYTTNLILSAAGPQGGGNTNSNSTSNSTSSTIRQGMTCIISAGYQHGNYGVVWEGPVFQAWFERENVVDFVIKLRCVLGLDEAYRQTVSSTYGALLQQSDIIQKIADDAFISNVRLSSNLNPTRLSRGKVVFGSPADYFTQVAEDNNMQWFLDRKGLTLARIDDSDVPAGTPIVYTPPVAKGSTSPFQDGVSGAIPGLVGVPSQTQYGVDFRVLMNPNVQVSTPATQVTLDMSSIVLLKKSVGELPSILDQSGTYIVLGARYVGDTRGQAWYTDVTGVTTVNGKLAMAKLLEASLNTGQ